MLSSRREAGGRAGRMQKRMGRLLGGEFAVELFVEKSFEVLGGSFDGDIFDGDELGDLVGAGEAGFAQAQLGDDGFDGELPAIAVAGAGDLHDLAGIVGVKPGPAPHEGTWKALSRTVREGRAGRDPLPPISGRWCEGLA